MTIDEIQPILITMEKILKTTGMPSRMMPRPMTVAKETILALRDLHNKLDEILPVETSTETEH
jgi:hypothetical protein